MDLNRRLGAAVDGARVEAPVRLAADAAAERDGDAVGASERELIADRLLKPRAAGRGAVDARVSDSARWRKLVAVAAATILGRPADGSRGSQQR